MDAIGGHDIDPVAIWVTAPFLIEWVPKDCGGIPRDTKVAQYFGDITMPRKILLNQSYLSEPSKRKHPPSKILGQLIK